MMVNGRLLRSLDHEYVQFAKKSGDRLMRAFSPAERPALTKIIEAIAASVSSLARVLHLASLLAGGLAFASSRNV